MINNSRYQVVWESPREAVPVDPDVADAQTLAGLERPASAGVEEWTEKHATRV